MMLFIDIGNTRIKAAKNESPLHISYFAHEQPESLFDLIHTYKIDYLLVTKGRSAQAESSYQQILQLAKKNKITLDIVNFDKRLLTINYQDSSTFGVDRFLNLLAAKVRYQQNFCVVSCGTAVTLDFFTNQHIGGMIAPGIGLASRWLSTATGLKDIEKPTHLLGNSTATSIGSGIYFGYQNLIYGSIESIEKDNNLSFHKVFTGGDSQLVYLRGDVVPELLFEGMQHYKLYQTMNNK